MIEDIQFCASAQWWLCSTKESWSQIPSDNHFWAKLARYSRVERQTRRSVQNKVSPGGFKTATLGRQQPTRFVWTFIWRHALVPRPQLEARDARCVWTHDQTSAPYGNSELAQKRGQSNSPADLQANLPWRLREQDNFFNITDVQRKEGRGRQDTRALRRLNYRLIPKNEFH